MEVKDRIKQKATELFMQYGLRSITMDEIAVQSGVSKKTIYLFFADKDALVESVLQAIITHNQDCCIQDKAKAADAVHEIFLAVDMMQEMFQNMNPSILYEMEKYHPKAYSMFLKHKYEFLFKILMENIKRGVAEDLFRTDFDAEVIVKARLETMMLPFNTQLFPKIKYKLVDIETQLTEHYVFGLVNSKGHKLILKYQQERLKKLNKNEKVFA